MRNLFLMSAAALALTACAPSVPNSAAPDPGTGVGFGSYDDYAKKQAAREAALAGNALPAPLAVSQETLSDGGSIAADTQAALDATRPVNASPSNPKPVPVNNPGISDENDFGAVGTRRSIEDDAARRAALKAQYQQVEPTAVPTRRGGAGPNIVDFALSTTNPKGQGLYRRTGLNLQSKYTRNCAKFASPDLAQTEFLKKGGPSRDRLGLDPDGDGFACTWDPAPFRAAKAAALPEPTPLATEALTATE